MALVLFGGSDSYGDLMYGKPDNTALEFIQQHQQVFNNAISAVAQSVYQGVEQAYNAINDMGSVRRLRAAARKVSSIWQTNGISPLNSIGQLQNANVEMQRWLMAEPNVRRRYHTQQCDGYSSTYRDVEPKNIRDTHYDYRRVVNGIYIDQPSGDFAATTFNEQLHQNEVEFDISEQADILESWEHMTHYLAKGKDDPTSKENNSL